MYITVDAKIYPETEFINVQFNWGFLCIILRVLRLEVSIPKNVYIKNQFKTLLQKRGGGVTKNSEEENSQDFCPSYVQEFGLCLEKKEKKMSTL
jgi:hypothetical protein